MSAVRPTTPAADRWRTEDAADLYSFDSWGDEYFRVGDDGRILVSAGGQAAIDVRAVVDEIVRRGVPMPVLIRFQDIIRARVRTLNEVFGHAIQASGYGNVYRGVYPIKVNQLHEVVEEVLEGGRDFHMGLECGSKAELVATLPHITKPDMLLICNGVKDRSMMELILSGQRLGQQVIPVMEKFSEFEELCEIGADRDQNPVFGVRLRLATPGSGRWAESAGAGSKFGINLTDLLTVLDRLTQRGRQEDLALLHFHLGSQIPDIQAVKRACKEMAQIYAQLRKRGFPVRYLDVGGGLGVNYDVNYTGAPSAIAYGLQEYANAVVSAVQEVCEAQGVPTPALVSESGRALTAHHSMLVVPVLGATRRGDNSVEWPREIDPALASVQRIARRLETEASTPESLVEACHDLVAARRELRLKFELGVLELEQMAAAQDLATRLSAHILSGLQAANLDPEPPEQAELETQLTDQYLCNFSVFQSMLDHWAIDQSFPIVPLQRLDERPTRRGLLVDLTCDSDGKISHYVSSLDDKGFLPLHEIAPDEPYYLGVFLMGAYQDTLGDAHNLFGRVAEVHVYADADEPGGFWIEKVIPATAVQDMLGTVQYFPKDLQRRMGEVARARIDAGDIRPKAAMEILDQYKALFDDTTYCWPRYSTGRTATGGQGE